MLTGLIYGGDELVCLVFAGVSLTALVCYNVASNVRLSMQTVVKECARKW
jgi:hypothetical protein